MPLWIVQKFEIRNKICQCSTFSENKQKAIIVKGLNMFLKMVPKIFLKNSNIHLQIHLEGGLDVMVPSSI